VLESNVLIDIVSEAIERRFFGGNSYTVIYCFYIDIMLFEV